MTEWGLFFFIPEIKDLRKNRLIVGVNNFQGLIKWVAVVFILVVLAILGRSYQKGTFRANADRLEDHYQQAIDFTSN